MAYLADVLARTSVRARIASEMVRTALNALAMDYESRYRFIDNIVNILPTYHCFHLAPPTGDDMHTRYLSARQTRFGLAFLVMAVLASSFAHGKEDPERAMEKFYDVVREAAPGLPGYTVYRPVDLKAGPGKLPVVAWSNGGCSASNDGHLYFLTQVAAHGFVVIAFGAPDVHSSPGGMAEEDRLTKAIDWAFSPPGKGGPKYFNRLDSSRVATIGHSCGGIDALWTGSNDDRVKSVVSLNSGCFPNTSTGGLSGPLAVCRDDLHFLGGPVMFVAGGPGDVAYTNSVENFNLVSTVPAVFASHESAGHGGFFGSASRTVQLEAVQVVVEFLDGTLNGNAESLSYLVGPDPEPGQLSGWTVESSGF